MYHRLLSSLATLALALSCAAPALAALTDAQACEIRRVKAANKYAACQSKALLTFSVDSDFFKLKQASSKCQTKYVALWPKLQAKFAGTFTTCDQNRFVASGGTVVDNLTGLQWEMKTDDSTYHDVDNGYAYTWGGDANYTNADGTAYDSFLWDTNGNCFAGHCDWRLPTRAELKTLVDEPFPCTTSPCISATFGNTAESFYGTASGTSIDPTGIWMVSFVTGEETLGAKANNLPQRAVRGGL